LLHSSQAFNPAIPTFEFRYVFSFIGGKRFSFFLRIIYSFGIYIDESCNQWQEYDLNPDFSDTFNVTKENMDGLEETGKQLLQEKVLKLNLDTFDLEEAGGTNAEALDR